MTAQIDLSRLPAPDVVEALDYEAVLTAMIAELRARWPEYDAAELESEPARKILEVCAYRELLLRQRVNQAARSVMPAFAKGNDLDHLAALVGVRRQVVKAGDPGALPPVPPTYEDDERLRARVQLAPEAFTAAGSVGAYRARALEADPRVKDVSVSSPKPGEVEVTVLAEEGDGRDPGGLAKVVEAALSADEVRPLTDVVRVRGAQVAGYRIEAELAVGSGPDAQAVRAAAEAGVRAFAGERHRLGARVPLSGLYAALHVAGVQGVTLKQPDRDVTATVREAPFAGSVAVEVAGG